MQWILLWQVVNTACQNLYHKEIEEIYCKGVFSVRQILADSHQWKNFACVKFFAYLAKYIATSYINHTSDLRNKWTYFIQQVIDFVNIGGIFSNKKRKRLAYDCTNLRGFSWKMCKPTIETMIYYLATKLESRIFLISGVLTQFADLTFAYLSPACYSFICFKFKNQWDQSCSTFYSSSFYRVVPFTDTNKYMCVK